jgi:hypothetical protein
MDTVASRSTCIVRLFWPALFGGVVAADQISKALVPNRRCFFDPGTGTLWPWAVSRAFQSRLGGEALDVLGCLVLAALGALVVRYARGPLARLGATVLLAGLTSNLLDRLGLAGVTQAARPRTVVNWFDVGVWRVNVGNVADCCYVVGAGLLLAAGLLVAGRSVWARLVPVVQTTARAAPAPLLAVVVADEPEPRDERAA